MATAVEAAAIASQESQPDGRNLRRNHAIAGSRGRGTGGKHSKPQMPPTAKTNSVLPSQPGGGEVVKRTLWRHVVTAQTSRAATAIAHAATATIRWAPMYRPRADKTP